MTVRSGARIQSIRIKSTNLLEAREGVCNNYGEPNVNHEYLFIMGSFRLIFILTKLRRKLRSEEL